MAIENIMYFALGLLATGLLALAVVPAIWRRAVRLTKKRIEAATPMSMAEFRADKDQLRAEFALSTRRLELTIEQLRNRLAEQLGDVSLGQSATATLRAERDQHTQIVRDLEARDEGWRARILELEKESADLAQRLRMHDRDLGARAEQASALREHLGDALPDEANDLTGNYARDMEQLARVLLTERRRVHLLEEQSQKLLARVGESDRRSLEASGAISQMRDARSQQAAEPDEGRTAAEARIASAGHQFDAMLAEAGEPGVDMPSEAPTLETQLETLRGSVGGLESTILADWGTGRVEQADLRERLDDIAATVSRIVMAAEAVAQQGRKEEGEEESLFDRVQRFADDQAGSDDPQTYSRDRPSDTLATTSREFQGR